MDVQTSENSMTAPADGIHSAIPARLVCTPAAGTSMEATMTCAQFFRETSINGRAALERDADGAPTLWLHRLPSGGICMDEPGCCPGIPCGRLDIEPMRAQWLEVTR
jgi:hypothetical protein